MATASFSGGGLGFGVVFSLQDDFSNVTPKIQSSFESIGQSFEKMQKSIHNGFRSITAGAALIGEAFALMLPFKEALNESRDFERFNVRLTMLTGSADIAHDAMARLIDDATSGRNLFDVKEIINANAGLIAVGQSADSARDAVMGLSNVIAAMGGTNVELRRAVADLQKIAEVGYADRRHVFALSYSSKIPIANLLEDYLGKNGSQLDQMMKKHQINFDTIAQAMIHATASGGKFADAMKKLLDTAGGQELLFFNLKMLSLKDIGDALNPTYTKFLKLFNSILKAFDDFIKTDSGKLIVQNIAITAGVVSLTLALVGLGLILKGALAIAWTAMASPIGVFVLLIGLALYKLYQMSGSVDNFILLMKGLAQAFYYANGDITMLSGDTAEALRKAGLLQFVLDASTWFAKIKAFAGGVMDALRGIWDIVKSVGEGIGSVLETLIPGFKASTDGVDNWRKAGELLVNAYAFSKLAAMARGLLLFISVMTTGEALKIPMMAANWQYLAITLRLAGTIIGKFLKFIAGAFAEFFGAIWESLLGWGAVISEWWLLTLQPALVDAAANIAAWWSYTIIPWLEAAVAEIWWWSVAAFDAIVAFFAAVNPAVWVAIAIAILALAIAYFWDDIVAAFTSMGQWFGDAWDKMIQTITEVGQKAWDAGANFMHHLWDGIKSVWTDLVNWFSDAWNNSWIGQTINGVFGIDNKSTIQGGSNNGFGGGGTGGNFGAITPVNSGMSIGASLNQVASDKVQGGQQADQVSPTVIQTNTERLTSVNIQVGTETLATIIGNELEMAKSRA